MMGGGVSINFLLKRPLASALFAAVLVTAIALGLTVLAQVDRDNRGDEARAHRTEYAEISGQCGDKWSVSTFECLIERAKANHEQKHIEADLEAQQDMASYTRGLLYVSIAAAAAGVGGFILLYANLVALERQTVATREIGEKQNRAYLVVKEARIGKYPEETGTPVILLEIKNVGATSALDIKSEVVVRDASTTDGSKVNIPFEDYWLSFSLEGTLPPGETATFPESTAFYELKIIERFDEANGDIDSFSVDGRLYWRDVFDNWCFMTYSISFRKGTAEGRVWTGNRIGFAQVPDNQDPMNFSNIYPTSKQGERRRS